MINLINLDMIEDFLKIQESLTKYGSSPMTEQLNYQIIMMKNNY